MSRALDYLVQARPAAMGAYFEFLREAGSRLDPRTRALISIITKASAQTEKGLLQYTRKALAQGVTAEEVLDALLMAFPALGLTRIVWAIDVLIEHAVPGFAPPGDAKPGAEPAAPTAAGPIPALRLGALGALPEGRAVKRNGGVGRAVLLFRTGDAVRAFKAYCTHHGAELMDSGIDGCRVTCKQHGWRFELPDGRCAQGEQWGLRELPVRIEDGEITVAWPE
jgi:nitrite reductase/ring-hydroxylating ferredoxin subunit/alkylhydroperoxidase/carboxymuconolactone decarboxylase family protein YurZ